MTHSEVPAGDQAGRRRDMRIGIVAMAIGIGLLALVALTADGDLSSLAIVGGAIGLNALIVGPYFLLRANAERLRRLLPPWLPW